MNSICSGKNDFGIARAPDALRQFHDQRNIGFNGGADGHDGKSKPDRIAAAIQGWPISDVVEANDEAQLIALRG
jgi:hypothetical protein